LGVDFGLFLCIFMLLFCIHFNLEKEQEIAVNSMTQRYQEIAGGKTAANSTNSLELAGNHRK
jgi:hypothetical protein